MTVHHPMRVNSAFNGIGLYNMTTVRAHWPKCRYHGRYRDGYPQCEHVAFHSCLQQRTRLYRGAYVILPDLISNVRHPTLLTTPGLQWPLMLLLLATMTIAHAVHTGNIK
jgi:hypothetical protein